MLGTDAVVRGKDLGNGGSINSGADIRESRGGKSSERENEKDEEKAQNMLSEGEHFNVKTGGWSKEWTGRKSEGLQ